MTKRTVSTIAVSATWILVGLLGISYVRYSLTESRITASERPKQLPPPVGRQGPHAIHPVTVVLQETLTKADGKQVVGGKYTKAVRSDGSHVQINEILNPGSPAPAAQRTVTLASGLRSIIDEIRGTKMTERMEVGDLTGRYKDPASQCLRPLSGGSGPTIGEPAVLTGEELIEGYRVYVISVRNLTYWLAPELGCATLRIRTRYGDGEVSNQHAVKIAPGEPDGALFAIPADYREVPPSQFYELDPNSVEAKRRDALYHARAAAGGSRP